MHALLHKLSCMPESASGAQPSQGRQPCGVFCKGDKARGLRPVAGEVTLGRVPLLWVVGGPAHCARVWRTLTYAVCRAWGSAALWNGFFTSHNLD
jgi:hypothetical protein